MSNKTLFPDCEFSNRHFRRAAVFGLGRPSPMEREAKAKLFAFVRSKRRWGGVSHSCVSVFEALLFWFHNAEKGLCFPSLASIAAKAGVSVATVQRAIALLERLGVLSWVNRRGWAVVDGVRRVVRASNGYQFRLPSAVAASSVFVASAWSAPADQAGPVVAPSALRSAALAVAPALVAASPLEAAISRARARTGFAEGLL